MDYYANPAAERALIGGALLFWEDFAPYAGRVYPEMFSVAELVILWRAILRIKGAGVAAAPPSLWCLALECVDEYNGAAPETLIEILEGVAPRRRLQKLAVGLIRAIDEGKEVADIVAAARAGLAEITEMETIDD